MIDIKHSLFEYTTASLASSVCAAQTVTMRLFSLFGIAKKTMRKLPVAKAGKRDMEDTIRLSETDLQARRLLELALAFTNAHGPISSEELNRLYYPGVSKESFRKVFLRDRKKLALCGLIIHRINKQPDDALWQVDAEHSYAQPNFLTTDEALALDIACAPLASDPSLPYADDLRLALSKIDRTFDQDNVSRVSPKVKSRSHILSTAERCCTLRHAVIASYKRNDGSLVERRICIYGFFSLRNNTYAVAVSITTDGSVLPNSIRTYRLDRFVKMKEDERISYVIPSDFCIEDYEVLPFQLGPTLYDAMFVVDKTDVPRLRSLTRGRGTLAQVAHQFEWTVPVSDEMDAAAWAIDAGIRPLSPSSLVSAWKSLLRGVLSHG